LVRCELDVVRDVNVASSDVLTDGVGSWIVNYDVTKPATML
jgi:hypothetical protein